MMENKQLIRSYCRQFKMGGLATKLDQILVEAETNNIGYIPLICLRQNPCTGNTMMSKND
jgi:hypothetical protein